MKDVIMSDWEGWKAHDEELTRRWKEEILRRDWKVETLEDGCWGISVKYKNKIYIILEGAKGLMNYVVGLHNSNLLEPIIEPVVKVRRVKDDEALDTLIPMGVIFETLCEEDGHYIVPIDCKLLPETKTFPVPTHLMEIV